MADVLTQAQIDEMLKNVAAGAVPEVTQKEEEKGQGVRLPRS